jgi:hypothetical protein
VPHGYTITPHATAKQHPAHGRIVPVCCARGAPGRIRLQQIDSTGKESGTSDFISPFHQVAQERPGRRQYVSGAGMTCRTPPRVRDIAEPYGNQVDVSLIPVS